MADEFLHGISTKSNVDDHRMMIDVKSLPEFLLLCFHDDVWRQMWRKVLLTEAFTKPETFGRFVSACFDHLPATPRRVISEIL